MFWKRAMIATVMVALAAPWGMVSCGFDGNNAVETPNASALQDLEAASALTASRSTRGLRVVSPEYPVIIYGDYAEVEFTLQGDFAGPVSWSETFGMLPAGLELEDSLERQVLLFGTPLFQGQWCFVLSALAGGEQVDQEVCLYAEDNEALEYPKFQTHKFLESGRLGEDYYQVVELDLDSALEINGELYDSRAPVGTEIAFDDQYYDFEISGTPLVIGIETFVLVIVDEWEVETYKQFQIEIFERSRESPISCPPGYFFDEFLGYCVQDRLQTCPQGTYFDPDRNACIAFPRPPPRVVCGINEYWDSFLSSCVRVSAPRCPLNFRWDSYYNRCVRLPYTCRQGTPTALI